MEVGFEVTITVRVCFLECQKDIRKQKMWRRGRVKHVDRKAKRDMRKTSFLLYQLGLCRWESL